MAEMTEAAELLLAEVEAAEAALTALPEPSTKSEPGPFCTPEALQFLEPELSHFATTEETASELWGGTLLDEDAAAPLTLLTGVLVLPD